MSTDVATHNAVRIVQRQRDFGSFKVIEFHVENAGGPALTLTVYSGTRLEVEIAPDEFCAELPAELAPTVGAA